jgi:hypothetical protein
MSEAGIGAKLGDLAGALLTLEVNTIVKAGMSAQKMPGVEAALGPARKLKNQIGAKNAGIESRIR